jgi:hypothetical protein
MKKPKLPNRPKGAPYPFNKFVAVLRDDHDYAKMVFQMVKWGRAKPENESQALKDLAGHVNFPKAVLDELGVKEADISPHRCSNNTKFSMLDFSKYV